MDVKGGLNKEKLRPLRDFLHSRSVSHSERKAHKKERERE
jgi:hypothetical protein